MAFRLIKPTEIQDNTFKLIGSDWMLITAGTIASFNTMTASWGGMGVLWNRNICWCVIRPQRYTYQFTEKNDIFTLSFFNEDMRDALKLCGTCSGKDNDKMAKTGLIPFSLDSGAIAFEQARLIIECRKDYFHDLDPANFIDSKVHDEYPDKDYHRMYLGEIISCLIK